ncbi:MAG: transporter [Candidatus Omnitrophota bacterium]|jgi:hypothetical protein
MHAGIIIIILVLPLAIITCADAALFTDDTWTMDKGHLELEYGIDYYKDTQYDYVGGYKSRTRETALYLYALYGLTDNWDIGLTIPYGYINYDRETKANGFMDWEIETKLRLCDEAKFLPSLALYIDLITDSGNEEKSLGSGDQDVWLNAIFSKTLKENLWLDLNLGYYFAGGKDADDVSTYCLGLTNGFKQRFYVYLELYGEVEFERNFNDNVCLGALSVGYEIGPRLFIKTGAAVGISDGADDLQISGRISFCF